MACARHLIPAHEEFRALPNVLTACPRPKRSGMTLFRSRRRRVFPLGMCCKIPCPRNENRRHDKAGWPDIPVRRLRAIRFSGWPGIDLARARKPLRGLPGAFRYRTTRSAIGSGHFQPSLRPIGSQIAAPPQRQKRRGCSRTAGPVDKWRRFLQFLRRDGWGTLGLP